MRKLLALTFVLVLIAAPVFAQSGGGAGGGSGAGGSGGSGAGGSAGSGAAGSGGGAAGGGTGTGGGAPGGAGTSGSGAAGSGGAASGDSGGGNATSPSMGTVQPQPSGANEPAASPKTICPDGSTDKPCPGADPRPPERRN